jgi:nitroimidazol reductase NimA-like FMN-containing flavoprotein (pyridoxamine 5'-phosphate oxidase superfamily)
VGVELDEDAAWQVLSAHHTGIFTCLRQGGWPVSVPVWFVVLNRRIYFWAPARTAKIRRVRKDPRVCFLVESGASWTEVRAVLVTGTADFVTDSQERQQAAEAFSQKYEGFRMPKERLPDATKRHYSGRAELLSVAATRPLTSWDNANVRLRAET